MDVTTILIAFIGGLGLFIFGMQLMANGLQKAAGSRMKNLLEILTKNRYIGVLVGMVVTAIIQSSSATTVMIVGFVNAGLMNLYQAVGVIMGANIGTTVTGWLVSSVEWVQFFSPTLIAPIVLTVGVALTFSKKEIVLRIGEILAGFGILFIGINMMSNGVAPLKDSPVFREMFMTFGNSPLLGILAGTLVTGIIQSSSASVGILQTLAMTGLVPWNSAVYIIMGQNIGTCVTALLSGIGATKTAKSAAFVHLLFNVIGSVIFSIVAVIYFTFINGTLGAKLITGTEISLVHTLFNISCVILLLPFSNALAKLAQMLTGSSNDKPENTKGLVHLDDRVLETPNFAVQSALKETVRMGYYVFETYSIATEALLESDEKKAEAVFKREEITDKMDSMITEYLVKICNIPISEQDNKIITSMFHTVNDIERIGDHCKSIAELTQFYVKQSCNFSDTARVELRRIISITHDCIENAIRGLENSDESLANRTVEFEEIIDRTERELREAHIQRLAADKCALETGVVFLDTLASLERISDQALNIAEFVLHHVKIKHSKTIR